MRGDEPACSNSNQNLIIQENNHVMGCYCIQSNENCREILWFLKHVGRFGVMSIANILYNEISLSIEDAFAESFDAMIENIVYPAFFRKFSKRSEAMKKAFTDQPHRVSSSNIFKKCIDDGPDCAVALTTMNNLLFKVFRVSHVLNIDIRPTVNSSMIARQRRQGTLIANLNFLLDDQTQENEHRSVAYTELETDLRKLGELVIPTQPLSLPQILKLLGYTHILGKNTDSKTAKDLDIGLLKRNQESCNIDQLQQNWQNYILEVSNQLEG